MKNFNWRYLGNYWADSLQVKTETYSLARTTILHRSLPVSTSGKKARQRSKVIHTFSVITQKVFVVATPNKNHWLCLDETHNNDAHDFFAPTSGFRVISG